MTTIPTQAPSQTDFKADTHRSLSKLWRMVFPEGLPQEERALARQHLSHVKPRHIVRARSRYDTGYWFYHRRVCVVVGHDALHLLAHGPRPLVRSLAFDQIPHTLFNHVTGQLVLEPREGLPIHKLTMPAEDALLIIDMIQQERTSHA